jgi:NAD(P)H-flavin reductase
MLLLPKIENLVYYDDRTDICLTGRKMNSQTAKDCFLCECVKSVFVAGNVVSLEFIWPGPGPRGGQFFLIKPKRTGVFLGRPVSVAGWKPRKTNVSAVDKYSGRRLRANTIDRRINADRRIYTGKYIGVDRRSNDDRRLGTGGTLRFLVARRGRGSRELADIRPGEEAELIGPLGNFWSQAVIPKGPIALVAGGIGIAPLLAYAAELGKRTFDFYAGFRTVTYGLEHINPRSLIVATEDDSQELKGQILDYFTPSGYSGVFACGPEPMLRIIAEACMASEIPCFISMEKHMACGVGACLGCTVKTVNGNRRCCADGPIFNGEEVLF